jgi:hypothetical protein
MARNIRLDDQRIGLSVFSDRAAEATYPGAHMDTADQVQMRPPGRYPDRARHNGEEKGAKRCFYTI